MDLSHACKSANPKSYYFHRSTSMVSPGTEDWKEMNETIVWPFPKSKRVTLESLDVLTTPT